MSRKKILFLPADSLPFGISRSYWLARGLAKHYDVFLVRWQDPRANIWSQARCSLVDVPLAFIRSILSLIHVESYDKAELFRIVRAPVMLNAAINRVLGDLRARHIARRVNSAILKMLLNKLAPDIVFHADGFYYFPADKNTTATIYADIQDDFDEPNEKVFRAEMVYAKSSFSRCQKVYVVSPAVAMRFSALYDGVQFQWLPNGADFATFRAVSPATLHDLRGKLNLRGRIVLSFIGSAIKLNVEFVTHLARVLASELPEAIILMVGNLPRVKASNIVAVGFVDPREIYPFFAVSDIGIEPLDTSDSRFLYNAMPLKIIQYAAAQKPVVTAPIQWLETNRFSNIRTAPLNLETWLAQIKELRHFQWSSELEASWRCYDWQCIGKLLAEDLEQSRSLRAAGGKGVI